MRYDLGRFRRPMRRSAEGQLMSLIGLGDGSTLSLDFTAMSSLDSRFTFSRSTNPTPGASFIGSNGLVQYAGTNQPRFDYTTSGTPRGLLIESSATNLFVRSEDFSATSWTIRGNVTTTGNTSDVTDPAGGNTATKVVTASSGSLIYCSVAQPVAVTANTTYTMSFWIRGDAGNQCRAYAYQGGTPGDLISQTTYTYSSTGWTRVQTQFTTGAGHTGVYVYVCSQNVTAAKTFYVWGAQLEAGSGASSYVFSGASQGQRAADVCTMSGTNFSSWFNIAAGTFLAIGERAITSDFGRLLSANANNTTSAFDLGASTTGRWLITNTTSQADITAGTVSANTAFKVAGAFANNDAQIAFNGTLGTADTSVSLPTVSQLDIGADRTAVYLNGRIRSIKFWPTRLPNATLQSITA